MALPKTNPSKTAVRALLIRAAGTNCDGETAHALQAAGAQVEAVHINHLLLGRARLHPYQMLVVPGGFSYGDDISAGKVLANQMRTRLRDQLERFVRAGKLVIGVCNGFQVLVKAGLLPGVEAIDEKQSVTLALNESSRFQCEWVRLRPEKSKADWLSGLPPTLEMPIAHGEGRLVTAGPKVLQDLIKNGQVLFRYDGRNPNGSEEAIAGLCNRTGNVVGLMPHPERFLSRFQHPNWPSLKERSDSEWGDGYWFWKKAVEYAEQHVH